MKSQIGDLVADTIGQFSWIDPGLSQMSRQSLATNRTAFFLLGKVDSYRLVINYWTFLNLSLMNFISYLFQNFICFLNFFLYYVYCTGVKEKKLHSYSVWLLIDGEESVSQWLLYAYSKVVIPYVRLQFLSQNSGACIESSPNRWNFS